MPPNISALSRYQIARFSEENDSVTPAQCNAEAEKIAGQSVVPTPSQGGTSHTVQGGDVVVQFRVPQSHLNMDLLRIVERAYHGFVPHHEYRGKLGELHVYVMNNIGGVFMYLARDELQSNNCHLLRSTLDDYARFFASAYHRTPIFVRASSEIKNMSRMYSMRLQQLREGLPERFHPKLDEIIPQLPDLFTEEWPIVPNHTDLLENNTHVDPVTGRITGICDWAGAEMSLFGMSLGAPETMLGIATTSGNCWRYHANHDELREFFWTRFCEYLGETSDEQRLLIEVARLAGLFLANGFQHGRPATEESEDLCFLGAVLPR